MINGKGERTSSRPLKTSALQDMKEEDELAKEPKMVKTRHGDKRTSPVWPQEMRPSQKVVATEQMVEGSIGGSKSPDQERPECLTLNSFCPPAAWSLGTAIWKKGEVLSR